MSAVKKLFKPDIPKMPTVEPVAVMPTAADSVEQRRMVSKNKTGRGRDSTYLSDGAYQNTLLGS